MIGTVRSARGVIGNGVGISLLFIVVGVRMEVNRM
jgi:hypothetical protein